MQYPFFQTNTCTHMKLLSIQKFPTLLFLTLFSVALFNACDKNDPEGPECTLPNVSFSYTTNIKPIIDRYCLSCHSGSGPGPHDYRTYEGLKPLLDDGLVLDRVVIEKTMPQGGGMSQAARDSINCWIQAGYPK